MPPFKTTKTHLKKFIILVYFNIKLIIIYKEIFDDALPSGNSVAALNLIRLANTTHNKDLLGYANRQLSSFAGTVERYPHVHSFFLLAFLEQMSDTKQLPRCQN